MKIIAALVGMSLLFIACSEKKSTLSEKAYQRSNGASEKALDRLDRE
jgi:hypothetical protein